MPQVGAAAVRGVGAALTAEVDVGVRTVGGTDLRDEYSNPTYWGSFTMSATVVPLPEITVTGPGDAELQSGDHVDFGDTPQWSGVTGSFTVTNDGIGDLTISGVTAPDGFEVVSAPDVIAAGEMGTLTLALAAGAAGTFTGDVVISSDDDDESSFVLTVQGLSRPDPPSA